MSSWNVSIKMVEQQTKSWNGRLSFFGTKVNERSHEPNKRTSETDEITDGMRTEIMDRNIEGVARSKENHLTELMK